MASRVEAPQSGLIFSNSTAAGRKADTRGSIFNHRIYVKSGIIGHFHQFIGFIYLKSS